MVKFVTRALCIVYFSGLGYIVFFAGRRRHGQNFRKKINPYPLNGKIELFKKIQIAGSGQYYFFWENIIGNILMFIPLPVIILLLAGKKLLWHIMLLYIILLSVFIELVQYLFNIGFADVDDILLNTLGGLTGMAIAYYFLKDDELTGFKKIRNRRKS